MNPPPRLRPPARRVHIEFPAPPRSHTLPRFPVAALLVPLLFAVPAAMFWGPMMLAFLVLSPVMMLANHLTDRIGGRRARRRDLAAHARDLAAAEARLAAALSAEATARRAEVLDPAAAAATAAGQSPALWARTPSEDAVTVRLGLADLPALVTVGGGTAPAERPVVPAVPVQGSGPRERRTWRSFMTNAA